jgi:capsular exopolysaccharide synthesis family protein
VENNQEKSPYLKKINIRIENLRNMISENITYYKQTNKIALDDLKSRINQLNHEIRKLPKTERELFGIERKFNINDALYTYLLEKRSEAEIAKASYQSDTKIIEPAELVSTKPVSPKKNMNYLMALFMGIGFPLALLRTFYFLNGKVYETTEAKNITRFPLLGRVYHSTKKVENVVENFPNSHLAESFRHIRVNLNYFLNGHGSNIIVVNSSVSGEGKSFVSLNLAETLAISGFKTALVGFDLRKPKKFKVPNAEFNLGVTTYLSGQATIEDIIAQTHNPNLDILWAGETPPNPSELTASVASAELLGFLRENYDYVIVDAPPVGIVSEAYFLMEQADLTAFIVRIKKTPRRILRNVIEELDNKSVKTCLVLNGVHQKRKAKYGYGYYSEKKKQKASN